MERNNPPDFNFECKAPPAGFRDLHPSPGAGRKFKGKDTAAWGGKDGLESLYFRCKQCGFINDRRTTSGGSGWGNDSTSTIAVIKGGTANAKNPTSTAGCPFCSGSDRE